MKKYLKHSDTYPYLVIHAMPAVYSIKYPENTNISQVDLIGWAKNESKKMNKRVCLVLAEEECIFLE